MNYATGRKLILGAFIANLAISLLIGVLNFLPLEIMSALFTFLSAVGVLVPAVVALGFAVMYADGLDKLDLVLAGAATINFIALFIYGFVNYASANYLFAAVTLDCLCAILPLAWAIKLRHKIPALSIAMIIAGVWTALLSVFYALPNPNNGALTGMSSIRYTIINLVCYAVSGLYVLVAFLIKKPEAEDDDTVEEIEN